MTRFTYFWGALGIAAATMLAGCSKPAPSVTVAQGPSASASETAKSSEVCPAETPTVNSTDQTETGISQSTQPIAAEAPQPPPIEPERFVLLSPIGPLVVHLEILIAGESQRTVVDRLIDKEIARSAPEGLNNTKWADLLGNADGGARGKGKMTGSENPYDANRNGRVERDEFAAWLAQDNAYGRAFASQSTAQMGQKHLFEVIDEDSDGRLSVDELLVAGDRLRSRDANDDDLLTAADFRAPAPATTNRYASDESPRQAAFELTKAKQNSIYYALGDTYDHGQGLDKTCFAALPSLFEALDANHNGLLDQRETAGLATARSDLRIRVDFSATADASHAAIELVSLGDDLKAAGATCHATPGYLVLTLPDAECVFWLDDRGAANNYGNDYRSHQIQVRGGDVDDPLFCWLDANRDGRLGEIEFNTASQRLAELDKDGDGSVIARELPQRTACVILRGAAWREAVPLLPSVGDARRRDVPGWLTAMDTNGDGAISPREFLGTRAQFARMDADGDGILSVSEAIGAK